MKFVSSTKMKSENMIGILNTQLNKFLRANDWITFFQRTHHMTEKEVEAQIKTPGVLRDFESVKLSNLHLKFVSPRLIPRSGVSRNTLNRFSILTMHGWRDSVRHLPTQNLLGSIPSRLHSPVPRVGKPTREVASSDRGSYLEVETSGT